MYHKELLSTRISSLFLCFAYIVSFALSGVFYLDITPQATLQYNAIPRKPL